VVIVAQAAKMARTIWAVTARIKMTNGASKTSDRKLRDQQKAD